MITPEQVVRDLERTLPILEKAGAEAMHAAVDLTRDRMRGNAPRGRTGRLGENISATVNHTQTGVSGTVRPREKYARYVDRGTGLQVEHHSRITPKAGRKAKGGAALKFADGSFRRSSKGQKLTRFIERTREEAAVEAQHLLEQGAVTATERMFR